MLKGANLVDLLFFCCWFFYLKDIHYSKNKLYLKFSPNEIFLYLLFSNKNLLVEYCSSLSNFSIFTAELKRPFWIESFWHIFAKTPIMRVVKIIIVWFDRSLIGHSSLGGQITSAENLDRKLANSPNYKWVNIKVVLKHVYGNSR